jgi:UDP-N-acetylmuramate dehydrogenase
VDILGLKGTRVGGAVVSAKHANFIVNDGHGTAADVRGLADLVRARVREAHGITLAYEIEFAGDWSGWPTEESA